MNDQQDIKDIILAEDDSDDVYIFDYALKELGISYELRHAKDGEILFVLLKNKIPYMLFLDIQMPCKDGITCIMEIRKNREYDRMPVIMYTSYLRNNYVEDSYRNGANFFLAKTGGFAELVGKLRKIFSLRWDDYLHFPTHEEFILS